MSLTEIQRLHTSVSRGAAVLDRVEPLWFRKITRPLAMETLDRCVLGQVFGGYGSGMDALFSDLLSPAIAAVACTHGFDVKAIGGERPYAELAELWEDEIEIRQILAASV